MLAALVFLGINGVDALPDPDELERAILAVAAGEMAKEQLIDWIATRVQPDWPR